MSFCQGETESKFILLGGEGVRVKSWFMNHGVIESVSHGFMYSWIHSWGQGLKDQV